MSIHTKLAQASILSCAVSLAAATLLASASCSKRDASPNDSASAPAPAAANAPATASGAAMTPVRGTIASVSDTTITVTTSTGAQSVHIVAPLRVYARTPSDLAHVAPNAFVGITSVAQPDGSQRATEIHIFPEALRGTGEGSRMMGQPAGASASPSRMTNGSVAQSRMTNGSVSGSRMTNGSVAATGGTSYTVQYQGGTQTIEIPAGVTVTAIAPTQTKLAVGANVVVLAHTDADGRLSASSVMLTGNTPK